METKKIEEDLIVIEEKIVKSNGETAVRQYNKGRYLGKGGFARCYEFNCEETNKLAAAKIIPKSTLTKTSAKRKLMSEIKIHRSLHHPNIVGFEHFFEDHDNVYILLELCTNQTMNELLKRRKRLTEIEVQCYLQQIIASLVYLQGHKIIHRDLKLGNFFISEKMEVKVGDFGLAAAVRHDGEKKRTICGTPNYIAPEVLENKGHSYEVDIWAVGVVAYTLLVGKPPFETADVKTTYKRIKMNAYSFPDNIMVSDLSKDLICRILITDPAKRLTLTQLQNHEFFHQTNSIPKLMPASTLACAPPTNFLKQYLPVTINPVQNSSRVAETPQSVSKPSNKQLKDEAYTERTQKKFESIKSPKTINQAEEICVHKWVDYSNKYGLGYILTNGDTGVFFNDSSKILIEQNSGKFKYYERKSGEKQDSCMSYSLNEFPKDLQKKITLLNHFQKYLEGDTKPENELPRNGEKQDDDVYVKKWIKTKHAIMFRLSNKIVQVKFKDHTEIILSSESRLVTYITKKLERIVYRLSNALESDNVEMTKRLKYTKELLATMLNNNRDKNPDE